MWLHLFDSTWVGYETVYSNDERLFSTSTWTEWNDPGILVTQSVHKQQTGFSQTSQIHKKNRHIKGQKRYVNHKRLNNAFMMHASTSPFYPLFAALMNAKIHEGESGKRLWMVRKNRDWNRKLLWNPVNIFARLFQKLSMAVHGKILIPMKLPMISDSLILLFRESAGTHLRIWRKSILCWSM